MTQKQAYPVLLCLLVMWLIYLVDLAIPAALYQFGLVPRTVRGLIGIVTSPFLHGGFWHLVGNTTALPVLLLLTTGSRHHAWIDILAIAFLSGGLLWLVGRPGNHIGASHLVFGLSTYLITVGIREQKLGSLVIAAVVIFLFGGSLLWGVIPWLSGHTSWDGHLCGAAVGFAVAYFGTGPSVKRFSI